MVGVPLQMRMGRSRSAGRRLTVCLSVRDHQLCRSLSSRTGVGTQCAFSGRRSEVHEAIANFLHDHRGPGQSCSR